MRALVGYTGFVGSNLALNGNFEMLFNSKNIEQAFSAKPDILYFSGIPAAKYLANNNPENDLQIVNQAMENIARIEPKSVVLISTVDVYKRPIAVDENSEIQLNELEPYGKHRYLLEEFIRKNYSDHTIVRLPGLFGENIKKNFIYDMIHFIPFSLSAMKIAELDFNKLRFFYKPQKNGFYQLKTINETEREELKEYFESVNFSAMNFTDSRTLFQFYNLKNLFNQIEIVRSFGIRLFNVATQPCEAGELYRYVYGKEFVNIITENPGIYDMRTIYANNLGGQNGYILKKQIIMEEIKSFINEKVNGKQI